MKSYTDIEQSEKLTEILPLESVDMYLDYDVQKHEYYPMFMDDQFDDVCIPSWSLTALFDVLPDGTNVIKEDSDTENEHYMCTVGVINGIISTFGNNPVDACYEMILKLNELNLL